MGLWEEEGLTHRLWRWLHELVNPLLGEVLSIINVLGVGDSHQSVGQRRQVLLLHSKRHAEQCILHGVEKKGLTSNKFVVPSIEFQQSVVHWFRISRGTRVTSSVLVGKMEHGARRRVTVTCDVRSHWLVESTAEGLGCGVGF
jgi:hypothetical protein